MKKYLTPIALTFVAVVLIFVQMLFTPNFDVNDSLIIEALYISSLLGVLVYGFISSRYFMLNQVSFGKTRKEIYQDYLKTIIKGLLGLITVIILYLAFDLIIYKHNSFGSFFKISKFLYFISTYMLFASYGYFQGLFKLKNIINIPILSLLSIILVIIEMLSITSYIVSIPVFIISLILFYINYKITYNINIVD